MKGLTWFSIKEFDRNPTKSMLLVNFVIQKFFNRISNGLPLSADNWRTATITYWISVEMSCASRTLKRSFRQFGGQAADREDKELTIIASIVLLFRACTVTARAMARGFVVSGAGASSHADADETTKQRPRSGLWQEFECKPPPFRDHRSRALRGGGNLLFRTLVFQDQIF